MVSLWILLVTKLYFFFCILIIEKETRIVIVVIVENSKKWKLVFISAKNKTKKKVHDFPVAMLVEQRAKQQ